MSVLAFGVIAFMLTAYVLLDGYDLGVAAIIPYVARTDDERRAAMRSIGPFWNGNEVWLIAAGGALFALFPLAYASAFSGFYLPLMVMLWLLMGRGIALELREHFPSAIWHQFWDAVFFASSLLLIVLFGVALGNLIRGVPLDPQGYFNGTFAFLLNPFALLVALFAVSTLALHGSTFLSWRADGALADRARALGRTLWIVCVALLIVMTIAALATHVAIIAFSWAACAAVCALAVLLASRAAMERQDGRLAFAATSAFIVGLMAAAAGTIFPFLVPAFPAGTGGISIYAAAPSPPALASALAVTIIGIVAVCIYSAVVWKKML
jgi:cytochrome bd ubiquinol oxidase subunit II